MAGRLVLRGTLRTNDAHGRLRLELEAPPGSLEGITAIEVVGGGREAYCVATLTPARHAELYRREAAGLLDKKVVARVRLRRYHFGGRRGTALDLEGLAAE
jgi:hypothetical protein